MFIRNEIELTPSITSVVSCLNFRFVSATAFSISWNSLFRLSASLCSDAILEKEWQRVESKSEQIHLTHESN